MYSRVCRPLLIQSTRVIHTSRSSSIAHFLLLSRRPSAEPTSDSRTEPPLLDLRDGRVIGAVSGANCTERLGAGWTRSASPSSTAAARSSSPSPSRRLLAAYSPAGAGARRPRRREIRALAPSLTRSHAAADAATSEARPDEPCVLAAELRPLLPTPWIDSGASACVAAATCREGAAGHLVNMILRSPSCLSSAGQLLI